MAYAAYYLCRKNLSVLLPSLSGHLGHTRQDLASLVFVYSFAYAAGQFLMGPLSDRFGARRVVTVGMLASSAATVGFGVSSSLAALAAFQAVNGIAQASGWSGLLKIMSAWFGPQGRGVLMAWWSTNYVLGAFLATVFATWAAGAPVAEWLGWRRGAWLPAVLLAVLALVFVVFVRDRPGTGVTGDRATAASPGGLWATVRGNGPLHALAAAYFVVKLTRYVFLFWLPLYMVERLGYGQEQAGYTSSLYELLGFVGVLAAGYASDHWCHGRRFPVGAVMLAGLAVACGLHPALSALGWWGNVAGIALIGMLTFGPDTLIGGAAVQDVTTPETAATAAGYVNGVGSVGQLLSPYVVATVVDRQGWDALFLWLVAMSLVGSALLATRWREPAVRAAQGATA